MSARDVVYRDAAAVRLAWRALEAAGRLIGHGHARSVAAKIWRSRGANSPEAFFALAHRISPRLRGENPQLFKVPSAWTAEAPIVRATCHGLDLELDLRDNLQALLFFSGTYEPQVLEFLGNELRSDDVFVDIGAHVGWHSLIAARCLDHLGGGEVFAFEPATDSADKIRAAAARNGVSVEVVQVALGDRVGETTLFSDPNYDENDAGVRSQHGKGHPVERVPVVAFDEWARKRALPRMDLVKIDVEGAEPSVIAGMERSLRMLRPRALIVEVKDYSFERAGTEPRSLVAMLGSHGYHDQGVELNRNRVFRPGR